MADANGHNSLSQLPPLEFDGAIESQQPAQHLPVVRFAETDLPPQRASINDNSADHSSFVLPATHQQQQQMMAVCHR